MTFALFDTAIGTCGIAWSEDGLARVQLPEATPAAAAARLARVGGASTEGEEPSPEWIVRLIADIQALLGGDHVDFPSVPLDLARVPDFDRRVYAIARAIPPGSTLTYGDVAVQLGDIGLSRAVGQALGRNPIPIVIPCHRVVAAGGEIGGFSATGGAATKRRILDIESAQGSLPW
jgi:methylated-DNA-[protein]-cysteine S-methyltransferase